MSRTTVLLVGLMLVGLIASPALAQTTVTFRDQHIVPAIYEDTPDPTYSNFSHMIQYNIFLDDYTYWRAARQHTDPYNGYSVVMPSGNTYAPLMEFDDMIGSATDTYDDGLGTISYVGQVPHGAVINSAVITLWRTNSGADTVNIGIRQVLDPDNLGHWGVNTDDPSWDPGANGWKLGAGNLTRNSYPDADPDILWDAQGTEEAPTSFVDILGDAESTVQYWWGGLGMYSEDFTMTNMTQAWADCLSARQGFAMTSDSGGGEIFGGANAYYVRQTLEISFTPSLGGDADKGGAVDVGDLGVLAGNYGTDTGLACWGTGDFSGDGNVDVADLGILAGNYGTGGSGEGTVPEPMTMTLLGLGALALIRRRK